MSRKIAVLFLLTLWCQTLYAYELRFRNLQEPLPILLNFSGSSASGQTWRAAAIEALDMWSGHADFEFTLIPFQADPCTVFPPHFIGDDRNSVAFSDDACGVPFDEDTLAITFSISIITDDLYTLESDIVMNSNVEWDIYDGPLRLSTMDFKRVLVHELGHVIGLNHEDDVPAIMASFIGSIDEPTADDIKGVNVLYSNPTFSDDGIEVILEEPGDNTTVSGVSNIRGWAVGNADILRIDLLLDGETFTRVPRGGTRDDVQKLYKDRPGSDSAGFSMAMAWSLLEPGDHTLTVRVTDWFFRTTEVTHTFTVEAFDSAFISDSSLVSLDGEYEKVSQNRFKIKSMTVEGKSYDVTFAWKTASQKFEMVEITPSTP